jgi:acetolactate synthase-1/3 small subunit
MQKLSPLSILVRNEKGVLSRVAGLISRRGFNIVSLAVGETQDTSLSRITLVIKADRAGREQAVKQLRRNLSVVKVQDLAECASVSRGLALFKVEANPEQRGQLCQLASIFGARVEHVDEKCLIIEVTGDREKIQAFTRVVEPYGIREMARTGQIVMARESMQNTVSPEIDSFENKEHKPENFLQALGEDK